LKLRRNPKLKFKGKNYKIRITRGQNWNLIEVNSGVRIELRVKVELKLEFVQME
jgi:hypothetical protein